jgi:hypothetical protein
MDVSRMGDVLNLLVQVGLSDRGGRARLPKESSRR